MKKKTQQILDKAHKLINESTGLDVPKYKKEEAKRNAKKLLIKLKEYDPAIYERIKIDFK